MRKTSFAALACLVSLPLFGQETDRTAGLAHFFPLILDGEGFRSHLIVNNIADTANECELLLQGEGLDTARLEAADAVTADGARASIVLSFPGTNLTLATAGAGEFSYGFATLHCQQPAYARVLLTRNDAGNDDGNDGTPIGSISSNGTPIAMAALESVDAGTEFLLPIPSRVAAMGLAFSNPASGDAVCSFSYVNTSATFFSSRRFATVPPGSTHIDIPEGLPNFPAGSFVAVSCDREIGVVGLPFQDALFTTVPAISGGARSSASAASVEQLVPLVVDGAGFHSELQLANPNGTPTFCSLNFAGDDLNDSRFNLPGRSLATSSGLAFHLDGGELLSLTSKGGDSLALGHAVVSCDQPVFVSNMLSLGAREALLGMASIPGSQKAAAFNFPVLPQIGRLAIALANDASTGTSCAAELNDEDGFNYGVGSFSIEPASTAVQMLDELFLLPLNLPASVLSVGCEQPVAAIGLPLAGMAFAAMSPFSSGVESFEPESGLVFDPADFPPVSIFALGEPIEPLQLPEASEGEPPLRYTLEPEVPGLTFDPATRQLHGTPSEAGEFISIYQAVDANGKTGSYPLFILVRGPDSAPSFADVEAPPDQAYTLGVEIEPLQLPEASGGNAPVVYFLSPELPGLTFDGETRQLRGTPTRTGVYPVTYNAGDVDFDLDSLEFTITVTVPDSARTILDADRCTDGGFVENPAESAELAADCQALVSFANTLIGSGLVMADNVILQWGGEGQEKLGSWSGIGVAEGRVVRIELPFSDLKGPLPAALGKLDALISLELGGNELSGPIPAGFGDLSRLETLDLSFNRLSGEIPADLGRLGLLHTLRLGGNELSGGIPPELGQLRELRGLSLGINRLTGAIPAALGGLAMLRELDLGANRLEGAIPGEIGRLRSLHTLNLFANELSGEIPPEIGELAQLEELSLAHNRLSGAIPAGLALAQNLRRLDLSRNSLSGAIPPELAGLGELTDLNLSFNALEGRIPAGFATAPGLQNFNVSFNKLRGTLDWAFRERILAGDLWLETAGNLITGLAPPPVRAPVAPQPGISGNAWHHSIAWYQGPLVLEWDWSGERIEHQTPILGRWALLAVRIGHATEIPPPVITRVLDAEDAVLAERLAEAAPPITEASGDGLWRSEFLFHLPGEMFRQGNQLLHVIDPQNDFGETDESDNSGEPVILYGEQPPKFRAVFIPLLTAGEEAWHQDLDPAELMAGTLAFMPIADDFEARFGPAMEIKGGNTDTALLDLLALWNTEAEPDEFYHGVIKGNSGGVALLGSQVAVSELSIHRVIPHEFGHNLGLLHTPGCFADGVDDDYPYPEGRLGPDPAWERNWRLFASAEDEDYTDIMSYCTELKLVSDYNYRLAAEYWLAFGTQTGTSAVTSTSGGPTSAPGRAAAAFSEDSASIAFSGSISADGVWRLSQSQLSSRQPRPPAGDGEYTLILLDADGVQVHAEPLAIMPLAVGDESFWAARTPLPVRRAVEILILDPQGNETLRQPLPRLE